MTAAVPEPGSHGGDGARVAAALGIDQADLLDLSQSLNPFAADARPIVARHLDEIGRYPDAGPATAALASAIGVDPSRVLLTNGGAEAIALVAAELGRGWVDEPDFALYRRALGELDPDGPRFRSNPHNPSGRLAAPTERAAVWDEAFFPLATGRWTRGDVDSIVVGSLTKLLACPGLRLGYVLVPEPGLIERLRVRQPEWAVNGLAAGSVPELLDLVDLATWSRELAVARQRLVELLAAHGMAAHPSDASWVLVTAPGLRAELAPHGVLIRDCAGFGMPGVMRIAVPDRPGLERLAAALARTSVGNG